MAEPTSLVTNLKNKMHKFDNTDPDWEHFVKDHKELIVANSTRTALVLSDTMAYNYRPIHLLNTLGYKREYVWIVMLINGWASTRDVVDVTSILLPNQGYIKKLYQSYLTRKNKKVSTSKLSFD